MPRLSSDHTRKLVTLVALVVGILLGIYFTNRAVRDRESALSQGGNARLRSALERMRRSPDRLAMTMTAGLPDERLLRRIDVHMIGRVDVLVIGQSDADHMSATFFKEGVGFYNGFLSSSFFAYQYEVFDEIARARGTPQIVLFDIRSGYLLTAGDEPSYDAPADDKVWWAGPPWSRGETSTPWYRDIDSLLSLQQTEFTARFVAAECERRRAPTTADEDGEGSAFRVVPQGVPWGEHRWLPDGSRLYPGEVEGVLVPGAQDRIVYSTGDRELNAARVERLGEYLDRLSRAGAKVIAYSPPLGPRVFEQVPPPLEALRSMDAAVREVIERRRIDYCDLTTEAAALGCGAGDFFDAIHLSRACNRRVVRRLANGCASRAGAALRAMLADAVLRD